MTVFTKQEKVIYRFLLVSLSVGFLVGAIRKTYFSTDYSQQIQQEVTVFENTARQLESVKKKDIEHGKTESIKIGDNKPNTFVKLLDINLANITELKTLPKIGPVTAERIIRYRDDYGNFNTIDDLLKIKGIGKKTLANLKPLIEVK